MYLVDEDYIENAELDMGIREEREQSLVPEVCPQCDEPLQPHFSVCPNCRMTFSPRAEQIKDEVESKKVEGALEASSEEMTDARAFIEEIDDPEFIEKLITYAQSADADTVDEADPSSM